MVRDEELMKGSELFRRNSFPEEGGFVFPQYFHDPFLPPSIHSLYDFSAKTQFTILPHFPPCYNNNNNALNYFNPRTLFI